MPFFVALVDKFYAEVAGDPVLLAVYPEPDDLTAARHHLALFLAQYWGGPRTYDEERGHPRLRMRHAPFPIGPAERDAWLRHMRAAIDALEARRRSWPNACGRTSSPSLKVCAIAPDPRLDLSGTGGTASGGRD